MIGLFIAKQVVDPHFDFKPSLGAKITTHGCISGAWRMLISSARVSLRSRLSVQDWPLREGVDCGAASDDVPVVQKTLYASQEQQRCVSVVYCRVKTRTEGRTRDLVCSSVIRTKNPTPLVPQRLGLLALGAQASTAPRLHRSLRPLTPHLIRKK